MARGNVKQVVYNTLDEEKKKMYEEGSRYKEFCLTFESEYTTNSITEKQMRDVVCFKSKEFEGIEVVYDKYDNNVSAKSKLKRKCYEAYIKKHPLVEQDVERNKNGQIIVEEGKAKVIDCHRYEPKDTSVKVYVSNTADEIPCKYTELKNYLDD